MARLECNHCEKSVNIQNCVESFEISHDNGFSRIFYCNHGCQNEHTYLWTLDMIIEALEDGDIKISNEVRGRLERINRLLYPPTDNILKK